MPSCRVRVISYSHPVVFLVEDAKGFYTTVANVVGRNDLHGLATDL